MDGTISVPEVDAELRSAYAILSAKGLRVSAKWVTELLCGLVRSEEASFIRLRCHAYAADLPPEGPEGAPKMDVELFARSLFDCREFARAAHILDAAFGDIATYPDSALFLRCYSLYLVRHLGFDFDRERTSRQRAYSVK